MQARSLMTSALPKTGNVRSTLRLPSRSGARTRLAQMNHRSKVVSARVSEVREAHTQLYDCVNRGRRW
jgi:hypothetical protein